jgi:hypothetical protein
MRFLHQGVLRTFPPRRNLSSGASIRNGTSPSPVRALALDHTHSHGSLTSS